MLKDIFRKKAKKEISIEKILKNMVYGKANIDCTNAKLYNNAKVVF